MCPPSSQVLRNDLASSAEKVTAIRVDGVDLGECNPDGGDYDCTFYDCATDIANQGHSLTVVATASTMDFEADLTGHSHDCDCDTDTWECSQQDTVADRTAMTAVLRFRLDRLHPPHLPYPPGLAPASPPPPPPHAFADTATLKKAIGEWIANSTNAAQVYGPIAEWNVGNVTDGSELFKDRTTFNEAVGGWDTSQMTTMLRMFHDASSFDQQLDFNTSSVTSMEKMFDSAARFNQPLNLDTSSVTNMRKMFDEAKIFNQPLNFNTSSVTTMKEMLKGAKRFNQSLDFDTSSVNTMEEMFQDASDFNQLLDFNTSSVTNMKKMLE